MYHCRVSDINVRAGETDLGNDSARDRVTDVLARLQDQLTDIADMQRKQAALTVNAQAADGTVEVTVDAKGQLVKAVIDKSYLDDHDFEDLGDHITEAARAAAQDAARRVAEMLAPIDARHDKFPSLSEIVEGASDPKNLVPPGLDAFVGVPRPQPSVNSADGRYDEGVDSNFPTVKRSANG